MARSMTGFGRGQASASGKTLVAEVRSVNHKYCEVRSSLPQELVSITPSLEEIIRARFLRGRVEVHLSVRSESTSSKSDLQVKPAVLNVELAKYYRDSFEQLANDLAIDEAKVDLSLILGAPGVLSEVEVPLDLEVFAPVAKQAVTAAVQQAFQMRESEGLRLVSVVKTHLAHVEELREKIVLRVPVLSQLKKEKLLARWNELSEGHVFDESRLLQEVVVLVDRLDVTEELERLKAHVDHFLSLLVCDGAIGRRLDFLTQEMSREANTLGAKCLDSEIAHIVIDLKAEVERIREQIQNIE